jgi:hypothetical protein
VSLALASEQLGVQSHELGAVTIRSFVVSAAHRVGKLVQQTPGRAAVRHSYRSLPTPTRGCALQITGCSGYRSRHTGEAGLSRRCAGLTIRRSGVSCFTYSGEIADGCTITAFRSGANFSISATRLDSNDAGATGAERVVRRGSAISYQGGHPFPPGTLFTRRRIEEVPLSRTNR